MLNNYWKAATEIELQHQLNFNEVPSDKLGKLKFARECFQIGTIYLFGKNNRARGYLRASLNAYNSMGPLHYLDEYRLFFITWICSRTSFPVLFTGNYLKVLKSINDAVIEEIHWSVERRGSEDLFKAFIDCKFPAYKDFVLHKEKVLKKNLVSPYPYLLFVERLLRLMRLEFISYFVKGSVFKKHVINEYSHQINLLSTQVFRIIGKMEDTELDNQALRGFVNFLLDKNTFLTRIRDYIISSMRTNQNYVTIPTHSYRKKYHLILEKGLDFGTLFLEEWEWFFIIYHLDKGIPDYLTTVEKEIENLFG
ncbi:MAG: hypothetical protein ACLFQV_09075 [Vulcanimicrobiota bacterium]